jgi:anhydro-N-acetylmuramic acid kinase
VTDLRGADLVGGGQGAPVTPIADWVLFRDAQEDRCIVNLGGFCNCTLLRSGESPENIKGFDVCACNQVIDAAARAGINAPYDGGGTAALNGCVDETAFDELTGILGEQSSQHRSLGTGDEAWRWVEHWRPKMVGDDLCATAVASVAETIADSIRKHQIADEGSIALAGGGVHNAALVRAINSHLPNRVETTEALGVLPEAREAACFAVLGALCHDGVAITLPNVTGGRCDLLSGSWINLR